MLTFPQFLLNNILLQRKFLNKRMQKLFLSRIVSIGEFTSLSICQLYESKAVYFKDWEPFNKQFITPERDCYIFGNLPIECVVNIKNYKMSYNKQTTLRTFALFEDPKWKFLKEDYLQSALIQIVDDMSRNRAERGEKYEGERQSVLPH